MLGIHFLIQQMNKYIYAFEFIAESIISFLSIVTQ
jgi:hypothetical protein